MNWKIATAEQEEYWDLLQIWESSVRMTHLFLTKADIAALRPLVCEAFTIIEALLCISDDAGVLCGFMGIENKKIEMLFFSPESCGRGLGRFCLAYAWNSYGACFVDVNEQNLLAAGFYRHCGFIEIGRSPLDAQGRPFPILHLQRKEK